MKKIKTKIFALLLCGLIATSVLPVSAQVFSMEIESADVFTPYGKYCEKAVVNNDENTYILTADNLSGKSADTEIVSNIGDKANKVFKIPEGEEISFKNTAPEGWYTMTVSYYLEDSRSNYASIAVKIDGEIPYAESSEIILYCSYYSKDGIVKDCYGNDIRPNQSKVNIWRDTPIYDTGRYMSEPLKYYLKNGSEISVQANAENIIIDKITLIPNKKLKKYSDYITEYANNKSLRVSDFTDIYEAERFAYTTDPTILPATDSSSSTYPHDNFLIKMNKISGGTWKKAGQQITYKINVPQDGLYNITLKSRQNSKKGAYVTRRLYVNNVIPFAEADNIQFNYSTKWQNNTLGNDEPWNIYLKKGNNEISIEAVLGDMGVMLEESADILEQLNLIYRELLVILGTSPDKYRDYDLDVLIPDTVKNIKIQKDRLKKVLDNIYKVTGEKGDNLSIFNTLILQLEEFTTDTDKIATGFSYYKTNIGSFGTWIIDALQQPLELDQIIISSSNVKLPKAESGLLKKIKDGILSFIASFTIDYNSIGNMTKEVKDPITVWITSGRDQMQVLKTMIQNSFVQQTGMGAALENVDAGAVLKAVAAGNGPDVLLGTEVNNPVNYALRNAAYDLNKFDDIEEIKSRFIPESLKPFMLRNGLYALPEVISFKVMFYRSDILHDMDLKLPETWEDVIEVTSILQKNNMTFGLPVADAVGTYSIFMYQNGGEMYDGDGVRCRLAETENTEAFERMTDFFSNYSLNFAYNFVNQFRTGEMPIAIDDIGMYNNLKISAPEIEGLWGIALIPGTRREDGSINRTVNLSSTAAMIINNTKKPKESYEFIKWWTSEKTQTEFGSEIETIMGPSSRYLTANVSAFSKLPWNEAEVKVLDEQMNQSRSIPQVPGSYYITRHINNAFRAVAINNKDLKDTIIEYTETIDAELTEKRKEFGMN